MKNEAQSFTASHFQHVFNNEFISHLYQFFMSTLNDKQIWIELRNQLNKNVKIDYIYFNISVSDSELFLDDVSSLNKLKDFVHL